MSTLRRFLRQRHWHLGLGTALLVLTAVLAGSAYWYLSAPTRSTVAVAPQDSPEARLINAFAEALDHPRRDIRPKVVQCSDVRQSAEVLRQPKVDLAVAR